MDRAYFEYNGINSLDMHLRIENNVYFTSPEADVDLIEIPGRDGEMAVSNNRLKGVNFALPVRLKLPDRIDVNRQATKINEWLKADIGWHTLKFSGEPKYEYTAICYEQFDIVETLKNHGRAVISFRLKPYKRRADSRAIVIEHSTTLVNPEKRPSKPLIRIEGSGDVVIQNNNKDWLVVNDIDGYITIDSELMSAYKDEENQFNKMNAELSPLFPVLKNGANKIAWSGDVVKLEINPRWEAVT